MSLTAYDVVRQLLRDKATGEELLHELGFDGTDAAIGEAGAKGWIHQDDESVYRATDSGQQALAVELLAADNHITVATADEHGTPWISPVFFVRDEANSIYWVSSKTARHSANIRQRPEVALVLFSTGPAVGLYIEARAEELNDHVEVDRAIPYVQSKEQPDKFKVHYPSDVTGGAAWRIYRARPLASYRRADDEEAGQAVTVRRPIELHGHG